MPATIEQGTANAEKIMARLVNQGRSQQDAARDACRWVQDNMGLTVSLDHKVTESIYDVFEGLRQSGWTVEVHYEGCQCARCQQDAARKRGQDRAKAAARAKAEKRSRAARKAHATRRINKAFQDWQAGRIGWVDYEVAQEEYYRTLADINAGR